MALKLQFNTSGIDWNLVTETLKEVGMASYSGEIHKKAFENSHTVVFVFDDDLLIGFGRAISDGAYQAAIYDVAVVPGCQGKGIGKLIVNQLIESIPECNFLLYSAPGKEQFYEKLNFRKMKTGMALFTNSEAMKAKGFTE